MQNDKKQSFIYKLSINFIWLFVFILVIVYFGVYSPIKNIGFLKNQIIDSKIESEKKLSREQNMGNLATKLKKIENDMQLLDDSFIEENGELELITNLENIAEYNQVKHSINLMPPVQNGLLNESIVNITVRGSYSNVLNYLRDLESVKYYMVVSAINMSKQGDEKNQPLEKIVNMNINAKVYWEKYENKI